MLHNNINKHRFFEETQALARIGSWSYDVESDTHCWSNEMYRILGLAVVEETACVPDPGLYIPPDDLAIMMDAFESAIKDAAPFDIEHRVITIDGEFKYVQSRCRCITGADGKVEALVGALIDITDRKRAEQENVRLAAIVESSDEAIASITLDGTIVSWNRAAERLYGLPVSEIIGRHASVLSPIDKGFISTAITSILQGQTLHNMELVRKRKNGDEFDISMTMSAIRIENGEIVGIAVIVRDITERKRAEAALRKSELQLSEAQRIARVGSWELDIETQEIIWSAEMYRIMGVDPLEGIPSLEQLRTKYHPDDALIYQSEVAAAIATGRNMDYDLRIYDSDHNVRWNHIVGHAIFNSAGKTIRLVGAMVDITERKETEHRLKEYTTALELQKSELETANAKLEALATRDGLTGLNNHRALQERLVSEFKRARRYNTPLALIMLDVDYFKQYNDEFGHPAGDRVLQIVAEIMQKLARRTDVVARYGGEEFIVILPQTDSDGAMVSAERLRAHIEGYDWSRRNVTVSIGVCCVKPAMSDQTDLLACADEAMYQSKKAGRNTVTCHCDSTSVGREQWA